MYEGEGKSSKEHENLYMTWMVPYEAGTITAKAWDKDGQEITEKYRRTHIGNYDRSGGETSSKSRQRND
mgnify:CR=1 FL=1